MTFDAARFEQARLEPRRSAVPVPGLARFFAPGTDAVWTVRGLSSSELHHATEAGKRRTTVDNILRAISEGGDQVKHLREAIGMPTDVVPGEIVKRQEMLKMASVDPVIDLVVACKLSEQFPVEFLQLTNEITLLTGQGAADLGKPDAASQTMTASPSA
jgi:hypothetical protein